MGAAVKTGWGCSHLRTPLGTEDWCQMWFNAWPLCGLLASSQCGGYPQYQVIQESDAACLLWPSPESHLSWLHHPLIMVVSQQVQSLLKGGDQASCFEGWASKKLWTSFWAIRYHTWLKPSLAGLESSRLNPVPSFQIWNIYFLFPTSILIFLSLSKFSCLFLLQTRYT